MQLPAYGNQPNEGLFRFRNIFLIYKGREESLFERQIHSEYSGQ